MTKTAQFFEQIAQFAAMVRDANPPGVMMSNESYLAVAKMINVLRRDMSEFSARELEQIAEDYFITQKAPGDVR